MGSVAPLMAAALERHAAGKEPDATSMPPARFSLDGQVVSDEWPNFQIDGYGTWLWSLREHLTRARQGLPAAFEPPVRQTARYLAELGSCPCFDVWEESGNSVHTSTLAAVYAGLRAAAELLEDSTYEERAEALRGRILAGAEGDGYFHKSNHDRQVDAALLWLYRPFDVVGPTDPRLAETVRKIVGDLEHEGGLRRYRSDTYYGGGVWPVLTASLGWYYASLGDLDEARRRQRWIAERFDDAGRLAEQFDGERINPPKFAEWVSRWGPPARELLWSARDVHRAE